MSSRPITTSRRHERGLSATAAVGTALTLALGGAAVDLLTGAGLRLSYAVCFVAGSALAALLVRRRSLGATVVCPPLVHVVAAVAAGAVSGSDAAGSWLVRHGLDLFTALVLDAPALLAGTAAAVLVALVRRAARRPRAVPVSVPAYDQELVSSR